MKKQVNLDAEFCGKVPLNQTNLIQPHGVLLVVDKISFAVVQVSENATAIFGLTSSELIKKKLSDYFSQDQQEKLQQQFKKADAKPLPYQVHIKDKIYLAIVVVMESYAIVEIEGKEKKLSEENSFLSVYQQLKFAMSELETAQSTEEACLLAVRHLKEISGFDKVMIYRFDPNWNGDVIAEAMEAGMEAYLGLKFPASDIPRQAREIYQKSPYRLIPNTEYDPVRLYPVINPLINAFTDLSLTNLRSVAAVHLEYLRNMKVSASMSTRIVVNGALWGLIACHHRTPSYPGYEMCSIFELLSHFIASRITTLQKQDEMTYIKQYQPLVDGLIEDIYRNNDPSGSFRDKEKEVLKLFQADGVALIALGNIYLYGNTPSENEVDDLLLWLPSVALGKVFQTSSLSSIFEPAEKYAGIASGLMALPIQAEKGYYILAFRPEEVQEVNWGGNPSEAVRFTDNGSKYHPRNSFGLWKETVKKTARSWTSLDIQQAERLRNFLIEYSLSKQYN